MSQPSQTQRGTRDRKSEPWDHRAPRGHNNRRPPSVNRYTSRSLANSQRRDSSRGESHGSKCTHICSRRGIVLLCAVLTNALVLICVVAALAVMSGMSAMGGLAGGSFSINTAYTPFEGTELQQVRDLDMQYTQMRSPGVYGGVAFSLFFGVVSLLFVVSGSKPPHHLPAKLLLGQFIFQLLGAVAYVTAVGLYLHFVIQVNSTDVCKLRERLYARQGYTWMNCNVGGADAAVALFGLITAILYVAGCILTGFTIRWVRRYHQDRKRYEVEYQSQRTTERTYPQREPLQSDIVV
ncbi:MARVEL domain-containing protein 3 [Scleropages formosus]|uniref:Si:ch211-191a24.4 n=1 Tax=Scleropages formosus TaxID=113540 RepID=A0A8C9RSC6_SCLFO|nr:MARVEL domain-containing protein 3-like [Scleropages formosus]XP_018603008.1 MARVEL domain-containing protein 3-like [Scleropages formosus]XP_018603016.1 MARVEL domain-containing protein 3-like [Scleropages formosus]XP_029102273.1 MARVEL domain-containing protein 3-like [Scleropages formosus]